MSGPEDQRILYDMLKGKLESELVKNRDSLTPQQRELLETALDFGYTAAFCERTADMNESFFQAQRFKEGYDYIKRTIKSNSKKR